MHAATICILAGISLLLAFLPVTHAAPPCDAVNFQCVDPTAVLVAADTSQCYCCPNATASTDCISAVTRCHHGLYTCKDAKSLDENADSCQCCSAHQPDSCVAADPKCPQALTDPHCFTCDNGQCSSCTPPSGLVVVDGVCKPCVVPNCTTCVKYAPNECSVCDENFVRADNYTCVPEGEDSSSSDGVLDGQSSLIAVAVGVSFLLAHLAA